MNIRKMKDGDREIRVETTGIKIELGIEKRDQLFTFLAIS